MRRRQAGGTAGARLFRWRRAVGVGLVACTGCFHDADAPFAPAPPDQAVSYTVSLEGLPSAGMADLAEGALLTLRLRKQGARTRAGLRQRVKEDEDRLLGLLRAQGHFLPDVASSTTFPPDDAAAHVVFLVRPGPVFVLRDHGLAFDPPSAGRLPDLDAGALGSPVGAAATAAAIQQAEEAVVAALQAGGYPYAAYVGREGVADPETATVTLTSRFAPGPFAVFGPLRFTGLEAVRERYLRTYWSWPEGGPFDRRALRTYQQRLMATGLFRTVMVRIPEALPVPGESPEVLPVGVTVEEGPRRRVEAGLRYDTDLGPAARAGWRHRSLFGANESWKVETEVGRAAQSVTSELRKPQFLRPGQEIAGTVSVARTDDYALDARTVNALVGLKRRLSPRWIAGFGGLAEWSAVREPAGTTEAYLLGAAASVAYDRTDDALDPVRGERLDLEVTPIFGELGGSSTQFAVFGARAAVYRPLDRGERYVGAARVRLGAVAARSLERVPATRRLYAGGGGSVRGYAKSSIGPLDPDGTPSGGRSVIEVEAELRIRVGDNFGIVPFAAAGMVSTNTVPHGSDKVRAAAGLGVRYFSGVGPIRADLAFPFDAGPLDDTVALYLSIGQAF